MQLLSEQVQLKYQKRRTESVRYNTVNKTDASVLEKDCSSNANDLSYFNYLSLHLNPLKSSFHRTISLTNRNQTTTQLYIRLNEMQERSIKTF